MNLSTLETAFRSLAVDTGIRAVLINGPWGAGKTYFAEACQRTFAAEIKDAGLRYTYVSLFGVSTTDEIRSRLCIASNSNATWRNAAAKFKMPKTIAGLDISGLGEFGRSILEDRVLRKLFVCIDDVERRNTALSISDVYGVISDLTQERECKCVVLLNSEHIEDPAFRSYSEKIFDFELAFNPSPAEVIHIVFNKEDAAAALPTFERDQCSNIRVMQRVAWALGKVRELDTELVKYDWPKLVQHVAILCVCHFRHRDKFTNGLRTLREWNSMVYLAKIGFGKAQETPLEVLLSNLKYEPEPFDEALIALLETGTLPRDEMLAGLEKANSTAQLAQIRQRHADIWSNYRNNFGLRVEEFTSELRQYLREYSDHIERGELVSDCNLLLHLKDDEKSRAVVLKALARLYKHVPLEVRLAQGYGSYADLQRADVLRLIPYVEKRNDESIESVFMEATEHGSFRPHRIIRFAEFTDAQIRDFLLGYRNDELLLRINNLFEDLVLLPEKGLASTFRKRMNAILDEIAAKDQLHGMQINAFIATKTRNPDSPKASASPS
jgi:hypothetical protein